MDQSANRDCKSDDRGEDHQEGAEDEPPAMSRPTKQGRNHERGREADSESKRARKRILQRRPGRKCFENQQEHPRGGEERRNDTQMDDRRTGFG